MATRAATIDSERLSQEIRLPMRNRKERAVMAASNLDRCTCSSVSWGGNPKPVCDNFEPTYGCLGGWCYRCIHERVCHAPKPAVAKTLPYRQSEFPQAQESPA